MIIATFNAKQIEALKKALKLAKGFLSKKTPHAILLTYKLDFTQEGLIVSATNLQEYLTVKVPCAVENVGSYCVTDYISSILADAKGSLEIEKSDEKHLTFLTNIGCFHLGYLDASEYPEVSSIEGSKTLSINCSTLVKVEKLLSFSASDNEYKGVLQGINFKATENHIFIASTDGSRLGLLKIPNTTPLKEGNFTLPVNCLKQLGKIVKQQKNSKMVVINFDDSSIKVTGLGDTVYQCLTLTGLYPNVSDDGRLIPNAFKGIITLDTFVLVANLKILASLVRFTKHKRQHIKLTVVDGQLILDTIEGTNPQSIGCDTQLCSDKLELGLDLSWMLDILGAFSAPTIKISIASSNQPVAFTSDSVENFTHIIMPVHIIKK